MVKPIGARCNLACKYCFYLEKEGMLYPGAGVPRMSDETLERFIRDYLAAQPGPEVTFAWQGGEPTLMGVEFFEKVVSLQRKYAGGMQVANALQTNGTLLDDRWGAFLKRENFLVGVSVDGPAELHDTYRVDRVGKPTFEKVMRGLAVLKKHKVEFNTLTVINRRNVGKGRELYAFLKKAGSGFMQFIPLVERRANACEASRGLDHGSPATPGLVPRDRIREEAAEECATPEAWGGFLCSVFDEWLKRDVGRVFVQLFDITLGNWMQVGGGLCVFSERCGRALALEHDGGVYACDHYVYPEYRFGNLNETPLADLANGRDAERLADAKANLPRMCLECPVRQVCNGDCPKHRFVEAAPGEPGVSYLCAGYRRFFEHSRPAFERMGARLRAGLSAAG